MRRIIFFFFFFWSLSVLSQGMVNSTLFRETFVQTTKLNQDRFEDLNKIFLGDTILFPSLKNEGKIVACVVNKFDKGLGLYHLTKKYILGELITFPVDTVMIMIPVKAKQEEEEDMGMLKHFHLVNIILFIGVIWGIYGRIKYWRNFKKPEAKPLIPGGLPFNADEALKKLIEFNDPGIYRIDRGTLRGKRNPKVKMLFNGGEIKISLSFGQMFYRVVYQNGETAYHRLTCGGRIKDLPAKWRFVPDDDQESISFCKKDGE